MHCVICKKELGEVAIDFGTKGKAHPKCLNEYHRDLDEQYVIDCCRQYGYKAVIEWIRDHMAGFRKEPSCDGK